ncbi:hypothetical protein D3C72_1720510 [compost metagenome]
MATASLTFFHSKSTGHCARLSFQEFDIARYKSYKVSRSGNTLTVTLSCLKKFAENCLTVKTSNNGRFKSVEFSQNKNLGELFNEGFHAGVPCFIEIESPMVVKIMVAIPAESFIENDMKMAA